MKIDAKQVIKNYEGEDLLLDNEGTKATLRAVLVRSANSVEQGEVMTAEDKSKAYQISNKLYASDEPNLTIDDMAFLKERVYKFFTPIVCGRVEEIFEGEAEKK